MSMVCQLLHYPHPILKGASKEIDTRDGFTAFVIDELNRILKESGGLGLAAPQIGQTVRIILINPWEGAKPPMILINPLLVEVSKETLMEEEGCLSIPGIRAPVRRHKRIKVEFYSPEGLGKQVLEEEGLAARIIQHEIDHLDGILFTDRLTSAFKFSISKAMRRLKSLQG